MSENILHTFRKIYQIQNIDYTPEIYNEASVLLEDLCLKISNLKLDLFGLQSPNRPLSDCINTDYEREKKILLSMDKFVIQRYNLSFARSL